MVPADRSEAATGTKLSVYVNGRTTKILLVIRSKIRLFQIVNDIESQLFNIMLIRIGT